MPRQQHTLLIILTVLVIGLLCHSVFLHRRLSSLSVRADIEKLRVNAIDLVRTDGDIVGSLTAGHPEGRPEIKLRQDAEGHYFTLGFAANGTGPYMEMLSDFNAGEGSETRIEIGAFRHDLHGLQIEGRHAAAWPPITLGWVTERAGTNEHRYVHSLPGNAME